MVEVTILLNNLGNIMKTLIIDSRERNPWKPMFYETQVLKLEEGDYTSLECLEYEKKTGKKTIRIERKSSTPELATNLGKLYKTFENEMKRLKDYDKKYIICEFSITDVVKFPKDSGIPDRQIYTTNAQGKKVKQLKMNGKFMLLRLEQLYNEYGIEVIYANNRNRAIEIAVELLQEYTDKLDAI